jgi:hypothetical protein
MRYDYSFLATFLEPLLLDVNQKYPWHKHWSDVDGVLLSPRCFHGSNGVTFVELPSSTLLHRVLMELLHHLKSASLT